MGGKMAAPELKDDDRTPADEAAKGNTSGVILHREIETCRFGSLHVLYYLLSFGLFSADLLTDFVVMTKYLWEGHTIWGYCSLIFTILPASIIQIFSLRWYQSDGSLGKAHWLLHLLFLGVLHRYLMLISVTIHSSRNKKFIKDKSWLCRHESDICMLHLFETFMGAAPQLVLQLYIMMILRQAPLWTSISCTVSFCSLAWAMIAYIYAMHKITRVTVTVTVSEQTNWQALAFQALWRFGMMISRIVALVLLAIHMRFWFPLCFGLHWLFMTVWVIMQNTDFCPTVWEERVYNCIIGLIYCFDFYNLRAGKSRFRALAFYSITVIENCASVTVFAVYSRETLGKSSLIAAIAVTVTSMLLGLTGMLVYYVKFHPSTGAAGCQVLGRYKKPEATVNKAAVATGATATTVTPRSLKLSRSNALNSSACPLSDTQRRLTNEEPVSDKHFLLPNIAQLSELAEEGVINPSCSLPAEGESVEYHQSRDDADRREYADSEMMAQKRRAICLGGAEILDLEVEERIEEMSSAEGSSSNPPIATPLRKRRAISSSLVLHMDSEFESQKNSSIENLTVIREKLSTPVTFQGGNALDPADRPILAKPLEFQQKDETMSCITSIHDYENVCPLGVARPPWCIRSWKGYTDIETYIHDDSVVRDRRRDTLTSTTTGTTYSSDLSDVTCVSSILRGILKQDDYLDTLTYDLIETRDRRDLKYPRAFDSESKIPSNTLTERSNATVYIAKPVVIDDKGGMLGLDTIFEERDEIEKIGEYKMRGASNYESLSTLVNTIDQIRRCTAENSPRHVYHTTGSQWEDSYDPKSLIRNKHFTRALFTNDLSASNHSGISRMYINSVHDSEPVIKGKCEIDAIREFVKYCTIESVKKTPLIDAILSDSPVLGTRTKLQADTASSCSKEPAATSSENDLYVQMNSLLPPHSPNPLPNAAETRHNSCNNDESVASPGRPATTAASSALGETITHSNEKQSARPILYPKRKFSLLKEKFESKSPLVYVVTPNPEAPADQGATGAGGFKSSVGGMWTQDKENLAPSNETSLQLVHNKARELTARSSTSMEEISPTSVDRNTIESKCHNVNSNLKEQRHIFLEQVLSPPKLLPWSKKKSLDVV